MGQSGNIGMARLLQDGWFAPEKRKLKVLEMTCELTDGQQTI